MVTLMAVAQVGSLLPHVVVPAVMPSYLIPEWNLSYSEAGLMAASYAAGYMLAVPVLTTLTDRIDVHHHHVHDGILAVADFFSAACLRT